LSNEFLNFKEISNAIPFSEVLNWLNIPFQQKGDELKGNNFIISINKNLFFVPDNDDIKGSVINFVAHYKEIDLREAASQLKHQFLSKRDQSKPKGEMPNLILEWDPYIEERGIKLEVAKEYEMGLVKQRSVMAGRIAFKIYNHSSEHIGYIGYKIKDCNWFFPKGFKRPLYNAYNLKDAKSVIITVDPFDALRFVSMGFKQVVSLLANSMTAEQEECLKQFRHIIVLHKESHNIVNRLFQTCFIKAPILSKSLKEMSNDELMNLIKPS